jgi:hypothetical protein
VELEALPVSFGVCLKVLRLNNRFSTLLETDLVENKAIFTA